MRDLLAELTKALDGGRPCVYCSIVETRGSTPQKAGAAMLVFADGRQVGTLGGGCVEAEVKRKALQTLADGADSSPQLLTFNLDDDYGWDDGLICGGRMTILADPIMANASHYYSALADLQRSDSAWSEAIALENNRSGLPVGARSLFNSDGGLIASLRGPTAQVSAADGFAVLHTPRRVRLL